MAIQRILQIKEQASDSSGGGSQVEEEGKAGVGGKCDLTKAEGEVDPVGVAAGPDVGPPMPVRRVLTWHTRVKIYKRYEKHQPKGKSKLHVVQQFSNGSNRLDFLCFGRCCRGRNGANTLE